MPAPSLVKKLQEKEKYTTPKIKTTYAVPRIEALETPTRPTPTQIPFGPGGLSMPPVAQTMPQYPTSPYVGAGPSGMMPQPAPAPVIPGLPSQPWSYQSTMGRRPQITATGQPTSAELASQYWQEQQAQLGSYWGTAGMPNVPTGTLGRAMEMTAAISAGGRPLIIPGELAKHMGASAATLKLFGYQQEGGHFRYNPAVDTTPGGGAGGAGGGGYYASPVRGYGYGGGISAKQGFSLGRYNWRIGI